MKGIDKTFAIKAVLKMASKMIFITSYIINLRPFYTNFLIYSIIFLVTMSLVKAGYYDKPEGEDCFGKILATNSYAVAAGLAWSTIDVLMLARTKGYIPTIARFAYNIGPMMGMASAFTLTTYVATNVRGKDDRWVSL